MKKIMSLLVVPVAIASLTGCSGFSTGADPASLPKVTTSDVADSKSVTDALDRAQTIEVKKEAISWGDSWTVIADGQQVATIEGKPIYMLGDTYSMFSNKGNLVGSEGEEYRMVTSAAKVYDWNNQYTGEVRQNLTFLLAKFDIYDAKMQRVASAEEKFNISLTSDIKDNSGNVVWHVHKDVVSWGDTLKIERRSSSDIPAINAVWTTVIMNEVMDSHDSSSSKK